MAWQSSLALQVEADDACTAMRLGERMENHVWGISGNFYTARNAMGAVFIAKQEIQEINKSYIIS